MILSQVHKALISEVVHKSRNSVSTAKKHCLELEAKAIVLTKIPEHKHKQGCCMNPPIKLSC